MRFCATHPPVIPIGCRNVSCLLEPSLQIMSLLKRLSRVGKEKYQFQFDVLVHEMSPVPGKNEAVFCEIKKKKAGTKTSHRTKIAVAENGTVVWNEMLRSVKTVLTPAVLSSPCTRPRRLKDFHQSCFHFESRMYVCFSLSSVLFTIHSFRRNKVTPQSAPSR